MSSEAFGLRDVKGCFKLFKLLCCGFYNEQCYPTIGCTAQIDIVVDYVNPHNDDDNDNDHDSDGDGDGTGDMYVENHCGGQRCSMVWFLQ